MKKVIMRFWTLSFLSLFLFIQGTAQVVDSQLTVSSEPVVTIENRIVHHFPPPMDEPDFPFVTVTIEDNTPMWAKLIYESNPNIWEIKEMYDLWRKDNWKTKNGHTRNYKKLVGWLVENNAVTEEGFIEIPSYKELEIKNQFILDQRVKFSAQESNTAAKSNATNWELIGPHAMKDLNDELKNTHINVYSITQSLSNTNILYCVTETGGTVFKTIDNGDNWFSVSDDLITNMGSRNIEVAPSNPDIVYLCTKHDIYKTIDGGITWNSVYYSNNTSNNTLIIHPTNPNIALSGGAEGILKTTDGGVTWTNPLPGKTIYDIRYRPGDTNMIYALVDNSTTKQTDFYKSTDGGDTWTVRANGWPSAASTSNIGGQMTTCDAYDDIIYVFIGASWTGTADKNRTKVLKSSDYGESWELKVDFNNDIGINSGQGYYDWDIEMSDVDSNIIALGTQGSWITYDDFATVSSAVRKNWHGHSDIQEMLFNGSEIWVVNDGGVTKYENDSLYNFEVKSTGINAMSFWSFDQGWNKDVQIGTHYHNGTSGLHEDHTALHGISFGGAEPSFSLVGQPNADRIVSKGYGSVDGYYFPTDASNTDGYTRFNYDIEPNMDGYNGSNICTHPLYSDTHFVGKDNKLMYSEDFGATWSVMYEFPESNEFVRIIEIPRSNTDVIYVATRRSGGGKLYKSIDGGRSFMNIPVPFTSVNWLQLSISHEDENILYLGGDGGNPKVKIYKSIDGGANWTNLWTPTLDGYRGRKIFHVSGTDGGIYVMTTTGVFYRNNTLSDWVPLFNGMAANADYRYLKPFYRDNALRIATSRGVYGAELYDTPQLSTTLLQPIVQKRYTGCARDTFYFDDFSVVGHAGATWTWSFPGATYVSATNVRNPKVVYGTAGEFDVTMSITKDGQTYSKTIEKMITVEDGCTSVDPIADKALDLDRATKAHAVTQSFDVTTNTFTFSAWMKPTESFQAFQGVFSNGKWCAHCNEQTMGLIMNYGGNRLYYRWPGSTSGWSGASNLYPKLDEWQYVAFVVSPDKVTLYLNEDKWEQNISHDPATIKQLYLGFGHYSKYFNGQIEEASFWNRSLTDTEIKELMHLIKDPTTDPDLLAYYQFNEADGPVLDKARIFSAVLKNNAKRVISSAPVGAGFSDTQMEVNGNVAFTSAGFEANFSSENGVEVVASKINNIPYNLNGLMDGDMPLADEYWAVHRYGSGNFTASLSFKSSNDISPGDATNPCQYALYKRGRFSDEDWSFVASANSADAAIDKLNFTTEFDEWSQYLVVKSTGAILRADSPVTLNNTVINATSPENNYTFSASNITADVQITAPANFEISTTSGAGFSSTLTLSPVSGKIAETLIYVRFNPSQDQLYTGTILHTSTGVNDLLVEVNGVGFKLDRVPGMALDLDGSSDYVNLGNPSELQITGDLTIQMWLKPANFSFRRNPIGKAYGGEYTVTQETDGTITFYYGTSGSNGGSYQGVGSIGALTLNEWNHISVVRDFTAGKIYWYINGVLTSETNTNYAAAVAGDNNVFIGEGYVSGYAGLIDEVRIWNSALSNQQIREEMHLTLNGNESDLVAYYQFNEVSGDATDLINGLDGTFVNDANRSVTSEPVGGGYSNTQVSPSGNTTFANTDFTANFDPPSNDTLVTSKIDLAPNDELGLGSGESAADQQYWVINRFGGNGITADMSFTLNENLTAAESAAPTTIKLYGRNMNSDGIWTFITTATTVDDANNKVTFDDVTSYEQYLITRAPFPKIILDQTSIDFGNVDRNTTSGELSYVLSASDLTTDVTINAPAGFEISETTGTGFANSLTISHTAGAIAATNIYVRFVPVSNIFQTGDITNTSTGATSQNVTIKGTGVAPEIELRQEATVIASGASFDFGTLVVQDSSKITFKIKNTDLGTLNLTGATTVDVTGVNATEFEVTTIPATSILEDEETNFLVNFTPVASGTRTATLSIENNDLDESPYLINLTGSATGLPEIVTSVTSLSTFDNQLVGFSSAAQSYTVSGTQLTEDVSISTYPGFEISLNSSSGFSSNPIVLSHSNGVLAATSVYVRFTPTGVDEYTGIILHSSTGAETKEVTMTSSSRKEADTVPGNMLTFDGNNDYVELEGKDINLSTQFTLEFWANFQGDITNDNSVFYGETSSNNRVINVHFPWNERIYFDAGDDSGYDRIDKSVTAADISGWHHWAFTKDATAGTMTIYRDGELFASGTGKNRSMASFDELYLGRMGGNYWNGELEEVRLWDVARTQTEIRENIHLTQVTAETNLLLYQQLNEANFATVFNVKGSAHGDMYGATRLESTRPLGGGFSDSKTEATGTVSFTDTDLTINYTSQGGAEVVVSKINLAPNVLPVGLVRNFDNQYWVINRFGTSSFEGDMIITLSEDLTAFDESHPEGIELYSRSSNSDTDWVLRTAASSVDAASNTATFSGINDFSQFIVGSTNNGASLPVELINFAAKHINLQEVALNWQTATEENLDYYELQYSSDGSSFTVFDKVIPESPNSERSRSYQASHENAVTGDNYYRLRIVDLDKSFEYSNVEVISITDDIEIVIYPNPVKQGASISVYNPKEAQFEFKLFSPSGKLLSSFIMEEKTSHVIDISDLPGGIYFYHLTGDGRIQNGKISIQ